MARVDFNAKINTNRIKHTPEIINSKFHTFLLAENTSIF